VLAVADDFQVWFVEFVIAFADANVVSENYVALLLIKIQRK
jgi:hypothetical protein